MKVLVGVTGGIAIYKSLNVIRMLVKAGHEVKVIMTPSAAKFIQPILFQTLCSNEVFVEDFDQKSPLAHIRLSDWADVIAVFPATANTIAKIAHGIADNLLTSALLAGDRRKIIFPAMNVKMYDNPATRKNLAALPSLGYEVFEPDCGDLACGYAGKGRLPDEAVIFTAINRDPQFPLKGKKYIVTAGATREKIDPVRYLSNFSSGKMGGEIALALYRRGAEVLLIHGAMEINIPSPIRRMEVESTGQMLDTVKNQLEDYDGLFMAAAPADFRPVQTTGAKIKRTDSNLTLELTSNPDILQETRSRFTDKLLVGFALETDNAEENAQAKLQKKGLDWIVLNTLSGGFNPLGSDTNRVRLFSASGDSTDKDGSKKEVADWLVCRILQLPEWITV